jgi:hypothetical protein
MKYSPSWLHLGFQTVLVGYTALVAVKAFRSMSTDSNNRSLVLPASSDLSARTSHHLSRTSVLISYTLIILGCLDPENFREFKLVEKRQLSQNVAKFKFALPTPTFTLGLPIGQHISRRFRLCLAYMLDFKLYFNSFFL